MSMLFSADAPQFLRDFLNYMYTIRGKSEATVSEYYLDLRLFFRYLKIARALVPSDAVFDEIPIEDISLTLLRSVTLSDLYEFLTYVSSERPTYHKSAQTGYGNRAAARARKTASLRSFFKYMTTKASLLDFNPAAELDAPKLRQSLPKYLSIDESIELLDAVDGPFAERDYCILVLFLNCGMRVSELVGLDIGDVEPELLRVTGKGDKERILYLNDACRAAIAAYLPTRITPDVPADKNALFVSKRRQRINVQTVKWLVKKHLGAAGLSQRGYSAHKLRHTAATLMYQSGVDVRTLQEVLGHEQLNTTMIYTHLSSDNMKQAAVLNPLSGVMPSKERKRQKSVPAPDKDTGDGNSE